MDDVDQSVPPDPAGYDSVCFTAGPEAAIVGAGTIHAYLAARRPPPRVVAGISLGALNAAAMQRCYREMAAATGQPPERQEAARWKWFREYLDYFCAEPWNVVWKSIPDQSDFFADMIPIRDTSVANVSEETTARRNLYLKVKLGRWLAQLPVSVRLAAGAIVHYVRMLEKYPIPQRLISGTLFLANVSWFVFLMILRVCVSPEFFPEHRFRISRIQSDSGRSAERRVRLPFVGWLNLFTTTLLPVLAVPIAVLVMVYSPPANLTEAWQVLWRPVLGVIVLVALIVLTARLRQRFMRIVKRLVLPLVLFFAYAYTVVNVIGLGYLVWVCARVVYASLAGNAGVDESVSFFVVALGLLVMTLLFLPVVVLPETRLWLVERGLLEEWPRPLFGWWPFVGACVNVASLLATCALAAHFMWIPRHENVFDGAVFAVGAPVALASLLLIPLLPAIAPVLLWRRLRQFANARIGWRKWIAWCLSVALAASLFALSTVLFDRLLNAFRVLLEAHGLNPLQSVDDEWHLFVSAAFVLIGTWFVLITLLTQPVPRRWFVEGLLGNVGLKTSLIPDFQLRTMLSRLFEGEHAAGGVPGENREKVVEGPGYPATVIVAAPLQTLHQKGKRRAVDQLWAKPGTPLVEALRCALSVPPLFEPVRLRRDEELACWLRHSVRAEPKNRKQLKQGIDLVDGSVIRQNPLPALFGYLRETSAAVEMAAHNDRHHPAIHVVYGVPIEGRTCAEPNDGVRNTIVDVGLTSLRLSQRRDTQVEVMQTNVIAGLEEMCPPPPRSNVTHPLFADEIAPESDLVFENSLSPTRDEILQGVASGCRRGLETLYAGKLSVACRSASSDSVGCHHFLSGTMGVGLSTVTPGLPEICRRCQGTLRSPGSAARSSNHSIAAFLSAPQDLCVDHPQLTGTEPRIVFVASGGVFRGSFHIGMLAALQAGNVKPDLIVGASVGTLMGAALGAMFCHSEARTLEKLVDLFLHVDERVALTQTLKSAARELGIRGRSIRLSPRRVRRMVRRGGRKDAGFAAIGAPPALVDAISDLLLIPHRQTLAIAASFVAGDVTGAVKTLITQLRTETIRRLQIEKALFGTALLEHAAIDLLSNGGPADALGRQPFQRDRIAFYGTTTNLSTHSAVLLGGNGIHTNAPFQFIEAVLASSAFPAVFEPRRESRVFPGTGDAEVLFADGGMFDNLPFLPAIEILSRSQRAQREPGVTALKLVQCRIAKPDLLIVGALDPSPATDDDASGTYDSIEAVRRRAGALSHDVKIRSFERAAHRVYSQLLRLDAAKPESLQTTSPSPVDGIVNAGVLPVFPASREHLNGTFSFCASTGLKRTRINKSIADGCYQTLLAISRAQVEAIAASAGRPPIEPEMLASRSVGALTDAGRIAAFRPSWAPDAEPSKCPYFVRDDQRFPCPFAPRTDRSRTDNRQMKGVFIECKDDVSHRGGILTAPVGPTVQTGRPVAAETEANLEV